MLNTLRSVLDLVSNPAAMLCQWDLPRSIRKSISSKKELMKKALRETQTLRAKNFRPAADSLLGGAEPPKFNQLEMVTTCTYRPSLARIDARNFELSW